MTVGGPDWAVELPGGGRLPLLGFGTWQLTGGECYRAVRAALEAGYRHIDTATMYRNEAEVGRAIADSGLDRAELFVTTKLPPQRADRARQTLQRSLRELGTGYVDLWLIHWPPGGARPDVWRELLAARQDGLARAAGVSNYSIGQLDELVAATGVAPAVNQIRWSPRLYEAATVAGHVKRGVALEGYSPFRASDLRAAPLVDAARAHGVQPAQVVVRWHLQHSIVVIPKSARPERIRSNADVFGFALDDAEMAAIDGLGGH